MEPIFSNDIEDITINSNGENTPRLDSILLIDADTIIVTTVLECQAKIETLPKECYTEEEWREIESNPTFNGEYYFDYSEDELVEVLKNRLQTIYDNSGATSAELHLSLGRQSFRYSLYPEYKAGRDERAKKYNAEISPYALEFLKNHVINNYREYPNVIKAVGYDKIEADDAVVYLKKKYPNKYTLCAIDKDVLYSVPGRHFNYYTSSQWNIPMQWVEVQEKDPVNWFGMQCIAGDKTDNIKGLAGYGPKKIAQYLSGDKLKGVTIKKLHDALPYIPEHTEEEMWEKVVNLYEACGLTEDDALLTARLVSCNQVTSLNPLKIKLFKNKDENLI